MPAINYFFSMSRLTIETYSMIYLVGMEVEYSRGGVIIFSYLILIHQSDTFGGLYDNQVKPSQLDTSEFIDYRFDGPPIAAQLYLTNSAKRKKRKPPRSAIDAALGRLQ